MAFDRVARFDDVTRGVERTPVGAAGSAWILALECV